MFKGTSGAVTQIRTMASENDDQLQIEEDQVELFLQDMERRLTDREMDVPTFAATTVYRGTRSFTKGDLLKLVRVVGIEGLPDSLNKADLNEAVLAHLIQRKMAHLDIQGGPREAQVIDLQKRELKKKSRKDQKKIQELQAKLKKGQEKLAGFDHASIPLPKFFSKKKKKNGNGKTKHSSSAKMAEKLQGTLRDQQQQFVFAGNELDDRKNAWAYIEWRMQLNELIVTRGVTKRTFRECLPYFLTGDAKARWQNLRKGDLSVKKFFEVLDKSYLSEVFDSNQGIIKGVRQQSEEAYESFRRRFESVYLLLGGDQFATESKAIKWFYKNLNTGVDESAKIDLHNSIQAFKEISISNLSRIPPALKKRLNAPPRKKKKSDTASQRRSDQQNRSADSGRRGARTPDVPTPDGWEWFHGDRRRCWYCLEWDHTKNNCPAKAAGRPRILPMDYTGPAFPSDVQQGNSQG